MSNIKLYKDAEHSNIISTGESGKIYINVTENEPSYNFRWSGVEFVYITTGGVIIGEITGTAYDGKKGKDTTDKLNTHVLDYNNPHKVTKSQVGLGNVDNTSDLDKPISTATQNALDKKVSKIDICNHGTQTNPESTGSKFYRLINNKAFYIDNATGYVAIEIPAINNPNYIFDILIIGGSKEVGRLNINTRVVSGEVYSVIANQYGLKEIIPVSAGLTQDGSKLAVLLGSSTWIVKTINVDISIGGQNSYSIKDTNATISFITDISSYKGIKTSNLNITDYSTIAGINNIQPYRDDNIFDKDPKSFNLNPGQSINVWGLFPEVGNGLLQIFRIIASASYKVTFFKYDTHDIYTRMWWDSNSSGGLRLSDWEKIPVIPMNGTSSQFIKGDGSLDSTEYAPKSELDAISEAVISTISAKGTAPLTLSASKSGDTVNITGSVSVGTGSSQVAAGNHTHSNYAPIASPTFTGTPKAPTAPTSTNSTQIATTAFVKSLLNESLADLEGSLVYKGTIGTSGTITSLPANHTVGWVYVVSTAGSYAGETCEVGDMIICVTTGTSANNGHWTVVQTNINGAVTGPSSSIDGQVAVFNGSTGKVIKAVNASTLSVGSATNWTGKPSWIGSSKPTYTASEVGALADDGTAVSAEKVENALTLKINSGTTEGTNKYTFNGSAAKSLNLVAGSNVTLTPAAGKLTIAATGTTYDVFSSTEDGLVPAVADSGKLLTSTSDKWVTPIPFYVQVNGGGTTPNAAIKYNTIETPTSVQNKMLMFNFPSTVSVQAAYPSGSTLDSETINVNFPDYFPNQYSLTITNGKGKGSNASYTGSAAVTAEIPNTAFPLEQEYYSGNKTIVGGNIYYPSNTTTSAVTFTIGTFTDDDPDAVIIVYGTRPVTFSGTGVYKMKNLPLTGSDGCYRVYCLSRMNTYQSNYAVYINCAEYESI